MIIGDALDFLCKTPPFSSLDRGALKELAGRAVMEFYPRGQTILMQDGAPAEYLYLIGKGGVRVSLRTTEDEEVLVDYRTDGDVFGFISLITCTPSRDTVIATEDTACYLLPRKEVLALLDVCAAFSSFFLKTFLKRILDLTYREVCDRSLLYGGGDKLLFTYTLADLATKEVATASQDISIQEAAALMAQRRISSLVLLDEDGYPAGMLTDRDLRDKVVARGRDLKDRVADIMSVSLIKSEARDYCFEALLKMIRYNIHHLLVVNRGEMRGIITNHDLMMLQGTSPLTVVREIEGQQTIDGLIPVARKINGIIAILIKEGARADNVIRIITEVNDRLLKKMLELTEARLGPPPVNYCWLVMGSEGRKEQTFRTDQDNAIIYADPEDDGVAAREYFTDFSLSMKDALVKCGFPPCPADYMASNPLWRQPLSAWKRYFSDWITRPTPEAVIRSLIFFDFRPVHGDSTLAEKLRAYLGHSLKSGGLYFQHMAGAVLRNGPPLTFWKNIAVEKKGTHRGEFNLKLNGLGPIVDIARLCALDSGVYATSTLERLREAKDRHEVIAKCCEELERAFEFIMTLRLKLQFGSKQAGVEADNFMNPDTLSPLEQRSLKEYFRMIAGIQEALRKHYRVWMIQ